MEIHAAGGRHGKTAASAASARSEGFPLHWRLLQGLAVSMGLLPQRFRLLHCTAGRGEKESFERWPALPVSVSGTSRRFQADGVERRRRCFLGAAEGPRLPPSSRGPFHDLASHSRALRLLTKTCRGIPGRSGRRRALGGPGIGRRGVTALEGHHSLAAGVEILRGGPRTRAEARERLGSRAKLFGGAEFFVAASQTLAALQKSCRRSTKVGTAPNSCSATRKSLAGPEKLCRRLEFLLAASQTLAGPRIPWRGATKPFDASEYVGRAPNKLAGPGKTWRASAWLGWAAWFGLGRPNGPGEPCVGHAQQLGGASPLHSLMEAKC
jgi:hypothetical protein